MRIPRCVAFAGVCLALGIGSFVSSSHAQETAPVAAGGTIAGKVIDKATGDPVIEAGVEVVQTGKKTRTDLDGKFKIALPPGTYELRVFAPLYQGTRLQNITVRANQVAAVDAALAPEGQGAMVEVVEVVAQADKAAEATQMIQRKKAAVASDNVAAESIKKTADKSAAEVVKRVPGVTVQNNKYVYVRGLGERYSSALLNGSRLPSTDPSKRVVPLDLFPAEFVESLSVLKSYTPDLPGDFSGGLIDIRLKEFPEKLSYSIGLNTGANSNATFQDFKTYKGGNLDYFGYGSNFRKLPGIIPDQLLSSKIPDAQGRAYSSAFRNIWSVDNQTAGPNFGSGFSIGSSFGPFGASLGGIYTTEYKERRGEFDQTFTKTGGANGAPVELLPFGNLTLNRSTFETRIGGVFTAAWKPSDKDKVTFRELVDRNSNDEVVDGTGENRNNIGQPISQSRLQYKEDQLGFGQIEGQHHLTAIDLDWRTALSQTTETEPDTRYVVYNLPTATNDLTQRQLVASGEGPESLARVFGDLSEYLTDTAVDMALPFKTGLPFTDAWSGLPAKFKFGPAYTYRSRTFDYRRFLYTRSGTSNLTLDQQALPPEDQLTPPNIGPNFKFEDGGRPGDSFRASQEIAAIYGMFDLPVIPDRLRFVGGLRVEYSQIISESTVSRQVLTDTDPLPGVNLIYSPREDMNFRYGYSRSVSRPDFRELTPTQFPAIEGEFQEIGNPLLTSATIESHDLRWDWFLSPAEIASVSLFYKDLSDPIENVIVGQSASNAVSYANATGGATLYGFEVEGRKNLGFLAPQVERLSLGTPTWLNNVNLLANVAYIESEVDLGSNSIVQLGPDLFVNTVQTNAKRALQGQAPYVVNAALEYVQPNWGTARLLYNTAGERIVYAGTDGLPDIFEQPYNKLDLVLLSQISPFGVPLAAKLSFDNILDENVVQTQGDEVTRRYSTGVKVTFGLTYTY